MATRIKVTVIDKKENVNLRLPGIPFWIISSLFNLALLFKPLVLKYADDLDEQARFALEELDYGTIKEIFDVLRSYEKFDLVDMSNGEGTQVKISIL